MTTTGLYAALARLARLPRVLVAADFDGTLAPLVDDPSTSRAVDGAVEALSALAALPGVTVALVSGRDLSTLTTLARLPHGSPVGLVGSHGAASTFQTWEGPDDTAVRLLQVLGGELDDLAAGAGASVERKPTSVVLHTRGLDPHPATAALEAARQVGERHTGVFVTPGKDVVELAVVPANKGGALADLAETLGSDGTVYFGDDVTDETAFLALTGPQDVTVKVGDGPTAAGYRVSDERAVVAALQELARQRGASAGQD